MAWPLSQGSPGGTARSGRTRTRYSFSTGLSSPIRVLATRPSCVSTSRPVESMSSRPAGARLRRWPWWNFSGSLSSAQRLAAVTSTTAGW